MRHNVFRRFRLAVCSMTSFPPPVKNTESFWTEYTLVDVNKPSGSGRKRTISDNVLHQSDRLDPIPKNNNRAVSVSPRRPLHRMPETKWREKIETEARLSDIEDEHARRKLALDIIHKKQDRKIAQARSRKESRQQWYTPQMRKATNVSEGSPVPLSLLQAQVEPQMFNPFKLMIPPQVNALADTAEAFNENLSNEILPQLREFNENIAGLREGIQVRHDIGQELGDKLTSYASRLTDLLVIVLIISVVCVMKPKTHQERIFVSVMIGGFLISRTSLSNLFSNSSLMKWFRSADEGPEPQMWTFSTDTSEMLCGLINMYMCYDHGTEIFHPKKFVRIMTDLGRATASFQTIVGGMTKVVNFIFEGIDSWMNGRPFFVSSGFAFIDDFIKEADAILTEFENKTLYNLQSSVDRVNRCIEVGDAINLKVPSYPTYAGLRLKITGILQELKKVRKTLLASNFKFSGIRQEPVVLFLRGPPGVGKSMALQHIAHAVSAITLEKERFVRYKEQPSTAIYNRQAENKYWDGYNMGHDIVFFDDILQARDVVGEPDNEAMNLIRCANIFEAQLHCAAIESKGVTNFRSNWIMATSNSKEIHLESINDIGAFMRRLDCTYDVTVKAEYAVDPTASRWARRIDREKLPRYTTEDAHDPSWIGDTRLTMDCLEFHPQKLMGRATKNPHFEDVGSVLTFDEMISQLHGTFMRKKREGEMYRFQLDETLERKRREFHGDEVDEEILMEFHDALDMEEVDQLVPQSGRNTRSSLPLMAGDDRSFYDEYDRRWFDLPMLIEAERNWWLQFMRTEEASSFIEINEIKRHQGHNYRILVQMISLFGNRDYLPGGYTSMQVLVEEWLDQTQGILFSGDDWVNLAIRDLILWNENTKLSLIAFALDHISRMHGGMMDQYEPQMNRRSRSSSPMRTRGEEATWEFDEQHRALLTLLREESAENYNSALFLVRSFLIRREALVGQAVLLIDDVLDAVLAEGSFRDFRVDRVGMERTMDYLIRIASVYAESHRVVKSETRMQEYKSIREKVLSITPSAPPYFSRIWEMWKSCAGYLYEISRGSTTALNLSGRPTPYVMFVGALSTMGVAAAVKGIISLVGMFFPKTESAETQSDERHSRIRRGRVGKRVIKVAKSSIAKPEGILRANENMTAIMQMVLKNNLFTIHIPVPVSEREKGDTIMYHQIGSCLGVKGRVVLMPYHFGDSILQEIEDKDLSESDVVILKRVGIPDPYFMLTVGELCDGMKHDDEGEKRDIVAVTLPKRFQPVRDIVKFFVPEKQQDLYKTVRVGLCVPGPHVTEFHAAEARRKGIPLTVGNSQYCNYDVTDTYEYTARTTSGDCGSPLFVDDKATHSVIIGMHVAGYESGKMGVSAVLTQEFVEKLISGPGSEYQEIDQLNIPLDPPEEEFPNLINLGRINPEMRTPSRQGRSVIMRSPLYGKVTEVKRAPARLLPFKTPAGEKIDPLDIALSSYCTPDVMIPPAKLEAARSSLFDMLMNCSPHPVDKTVYSFEEGVLGDGPGSEFASVPRVKSAGFPYNVMPGITSKCRFFGTGDDYNLDNPECEKLKEECATVIRNAENGIRMTHVFTDSLKDERRSLAKVASGKTRMFSGSPTPLLIVSRQYFGAFQKWIVRNRILNGIAIGINEYSSDWDLVARRLLQFGPMKNVGAGDYQGFDQKHKPAIMWEILKIIEDWYGYEDPKATRVREILWYELVNSRHVVKGHLVAWPSSMPSGHPLTALVNCLYNHMLFRLCWIDLINPIRMDAHSFNKCAYLIAMGDDNVFAVRAEYAEIFNEANLQRVMRSYGEVYTPEDKELTNFGHQLRSLEEVTFLKRRFRFARNLGRYVAPLDLDAILDILNWNRSGANVLGDTEEAVRNVLCELTLHGPEVFEYWKRRILSAIEGTIGISHPEVTSYAVLLRSVLSRETGFWGNERFFTDYDEIREKSVVPQSGFRRFGELRAGLFSLTARTAPLQPRVCPGPHGTRPCLAQLSCVE